MTKYYSVSLYEYESGWGSKEDERYYFRSKILADNYVRDFNSKNTEEVAPSWYMIAYPASLIDSYEQVTNLNLYFAVNKDRNRVSRRDLKKFVSEHEVVY